MKSDLAYSAAPINALRMWSDGRRLLVELPGPYIVAFSLTEGGLSKALNLLRDRRYDFTAPTCVMQSKENAMVEAALRKRGII